MKKNLIKSIMNLPMPINISNFWNFGSMLGIFFMIQIISGLILASSYIPNSLMSFNQIMYMSRNVNFGWFMLFEHSNGASILFIFMYLHISRNLYFKSFYMKKSWFSGMLIFLLTMITAFLGYTLPWGQMSFWGTTVITNLLSSIPYIGNSMIIWLWGSFYINSSTLNRFFMLHFLIPLISIIIIIIHMIFLHQTGSSNPLGINNNMNMIHFNPYFMIKDLMIILIFMIPMYQILMMTPLLLNNPDNFYQANPMITPNNIQPEWYFLFSYTILRSIPNKLGGIISLVMSILILFFLPLNHMNLKSFNFYPMNKFLMWMFFSLFIMLTWMGMNPINNKILWVSQMMTFSYFIFFPINIILSNISDKILKI